MADELVPIQNSSDTLEEKIMDAIAGVAAGLTAGQEETRRIEIADKAQARKDRVEREKAARADAMAAAAAARADAMAAEEARAKREEEAEGRDRRWGVGVGVLVIAIGAGFLVLGHKDLAVPAFQVGLGFFAGFVSGRKSK